MVAIFTGAGTGFERGSGAVLGGMGLLGQGALGRNGEQVMLNAANGNLLITQRDEFLVGRGPDAAISRTYNSQGNFSDEHGENGNNWRHSTQQVLTWGWGHLNQAGSAVRRHTSDGSETIYSWNGSEYVSADGAGAHDSLVYIGGGWRWTDGNSRTTETYADFNGQARLVERADTSGNRMTYAYAGDKLSRVTTADGGYVDYHWSGNNITQITAGSHGTARTRTRYGYDHLSRLTSVTVDLSPNDHHQGGDGYTTTYGYHGDSRLVAFIAQTDGSRMDFGYDGAGRVTQMTQKIADGVGRTTTIAYGHLHTHVTDATGQLTALEYNADGSLRTVIAPPAHWGAPQQVVRFGYNGNGDLTSVMDAAGRVTSYAHDARGNVVSETDRLGNVVTRTYGARNELLTETRIGSDAASAASRQTTRYAYDGANRLRFVVSAQGAVTEHWYNGYGQLTAEAQHTDRYMDVAGMDPAASLSEAQVLGWRDSFDKTQLTIVENRYDARGNVAERVSYGGSNWHGHAQTGDGYTHQYFTYDQTGQLLNKATASLGTEHFSYDGLGRLIRSTDLNGGATSIVFNDAATQTVVTLANGFVQTSSYNKAGDLVAHTDGGDFVAGGTTNHRYDRLGRLRMTTDATGRNSFFIYDKVGRKVADITHDGHITEYRYDANDRVVATVRYTHGSGWAADHYPNPEVHLDMSQVRPGGHPWDVWNWQVYDADGRVIQSIDGDGGVTALEYDASDRLVRTTSYANKLAPWQVAEFKNAAPAGLVLPPGSGEDKVSRNFYDRDGLLVGAIDGEGYLTRVHYDADGKKVAETAYANATHPDLRGGHNIRRTRSSTPVLDQQGNFSYQTSADHWYRFDAMNRVVTQKGQLVDGRIVRGTTGTDYSYDQAGQRRSATRNVGRTATIANPNYDPEPYYYDDYNYPRHETINGNPYMQVHYDAESREDFTYDAAGGLSQVRIAESGYSDNGDGTITVTPPPWNGQLKASYWQDVLGRNTRQIDWAGNGDWGGAAMYDRTIEYNGKGQVHRELVTQRQGNDTIVSETWNEYGHNGNQALGAVTGSTTHTWKNGAFQTTARTDTGYQWWDGAVAGHVTYRPNTGQNTTYSTYYNYDGQGALVSANIYDGRSRTVSWTNDMGGQAIRRDEYDNLSGGDPHEIWFRFGGKQMGYSGNNGTTDTDYTSSVAARTRAAPTTTTGAFRGGTTYGATHTDFDLSLESINSYEQGGSGGGYTVRGGDTLSGIAANLWGDAGLWYKLAEANGLSRESGLVEGQRLTIPSGVTKNTHNASTFKPYDPSDAIGETSPTNPAPSKAAKKNKCGMFGAILLVAIAVAVTVVTAGAALAATGAVAGGLTTTGIGAGIAAFTGAAGAASVGAGALIAAGAVGGIVGSIASQGVGVATGIQDKFSWKAVAMAGIAGGVGAGLGGIGGPGFVGGAIRGALGSAITQGIGVATGLQKKFDWAGVAAAGIGGGVSAEFGGVFKKAGYGKYATQALSSGAGAIANAATRSLINGSNFGDNILAALPDVIGSTLGNMVADGLSGLLRGAGPAAPSKPSSAAEAQLAEDSLSPEARSYLAQRGVRFVGQADGSTLVEGYENIRDELAAGGSDELRQFFGTDGQISGFGLGHAFFDVAPHAQQGAIGDLGGLNFDFDDPYGSVTSNWMFTAGGGALRFISGANGGPTYLYGGGAQRIDGLGLSISYGADSGFQLPSVDIETSVRSAFGGTPSFGYLSMASMFKAPTFNYDPNAYSYGGRNYTAATYPGPVVTNIRPRMPGQMTPPQFAAHIDRLRGGSLGAIAYGFAHRSGASPAVQDLAHGLGSSLDGFALGRTVRPLGAQGTVVGAPRPYANPRNRPSYGSGLVDAVWNNAMRNGRVVDPNTGERLNWDRTTSRAGQWDMGHKPHSEYRHLHSRYVSGEISYQQFIREYRDPSNYRPELPGSNRGRRHEGR